MTSGGDAMGLMNVHIYIIKKRDSGNKKMENNPNSKKTFLYHRKTNCTCSFFIKCDI